MAHFNVPVWAFVSVCFIFGLGQAYEDWSVEDTQSWLRQIGLDQVLGPGFKLHGYDGKALEVLEEEDVFRQAEFPLATKVHFKILQKQLARLVPTTRPTTSNINTNEESTTANKQSGNNNINANKRFHPNNINANKRPSFPRARRLQQSNASLASSHAMRLRADLLANYDPLTAPFTYSPEGKIVPVDVSFGLLLYAIRKVDVPSSELELLVWARTGWTDHRLAWDPKDYGGIDQITFHADINEPGQVWIPDVDLYNTPTSLYSLANKPVMIWSSGSAYHSRSGIATIMCPFNGIENFPFDTLSCEFVIAGWGQSGLFVNYKIMGKGYEFQEKDEVLLDKGEQNRHYIFARKNNVSVSIEDVFYPCCPSEPWPTITYTIRIARRANSFYFRFLVFPQTLLTFVSMAVFFFDLQVGERLGFGMTIVLVLSVAEVVVAPYIPVCNSWLWSSKYGFVSFLHALLALVESCVIVYVYYDMEGFSICNVLYWREMGSEEAAQTWPCCYKVHKHLFSGKVRADADTADPGPNMNTKTAGSDSPHSMGDMDPKKTTIVTPLSTNNNIWLEDEGASPRSTASAASPSRARALSRPMTPRHNHFLLERGIRPQAIQMAKQIDFVFRVFMPISYTICIAYLFTLIPKQDG